MLRLIDLHLREDNPTALIVNRQALQVLTKVRFDAALGLGKKSEIHPIASQTSERTERECPCVPQWIEQTWAGVQFAQAPAAPDKVIFLLLCRVLKFAANS